MLTLRKLKQLLITLAIVISSATTPLLVPATVTFAAPDPAGNAEKTGNDPASQVCKGVNAASSDSNPDNACTGNQFNNFIHNIINILLFIIGLISVIVIIIGGIRYVVSAGDQSAITAAKNTILYAVVGLIVAAMAYAIVNFVIANIH